MRIYKNLLKPGWRRVSVAAALSVCLMQFTSCTKYDLDENDPAGWGASIYSYLEDDGNYTNTVRLINDLGLKDALGKTTSSTLFVADDDAYARFFANNKWGVRSYEQLTLSQKKMLLNGSRISNSYQVDDLSGLPSDGGPNEGQCMRRVTAQTELDTVSVMRPDQLPNMTEADWRWNKSWRKFMGRDKVLLLRDGTIPPMLHFIESHMANNKITNDDYNFLYNYTTDRQPGDASVNGVKMEQQNIRCSNGFIHKMQEVIMPLDNMAEIIASKPQVSIYNRLLERFCAPIAVSKEMVDRYNATFGTNVDSIFMKRFFSEKSQGCTSLKKDDDNRTIEQILSYDPEWNEYYTAPVPTAAEAIKKNMAFMLVPSNAAMEAYWEGPGKALKDQYGTWDNVPNRVVKNLINNNMLDDFVGKGVPSKFDAILNDANDPMGVTKATIDSVWLGCNGAVYLTNKVFSPTSFVSVLYPAVVNENLQIINWAVEKCQYHVYLNSLNSYYSFFIPTNGALLDYIDPASFAKETTQLYRFHYENTEENEAKGKSGSVWAAIYAYDLETGTIGDSIREERDENVLKSKLKDVLDNHIVIGNVEDGNTYYKTKGGQEIKINNASLGVNGMTVEGSRQINETGSPLRVTYIYDQTAQGNGKCYILEAEPIQTTKKSTIDVMREHDEMSEMVKLLEGSSLLETIHDDKYACVSENFSVFNTFNYTVYVPTNQAIRDLQNNGQLPTWDDVIRAQEEERYDDATRDSLAIENFLRYHIQDGALYIGSTPLKEEGYETALIGSNGKFQRVYATLTRDNISIKASQTDKTSRKVVKDSGLYNLMAREYILEGTDAKTATNVYTTSTAVIHLIDGALINKQ